MEKEILQEAKRHRRPIQEAAQKDDGLDSQQEVTYQLDGRKSLKRDDWRNKDYWWCEASNTVYTQKHCDLCRLMPYSQIVKKMHER